MKVFIYIVSFFFFPQILAQNYTCTVEGEVRAQLTGEPLENVNVYISGTTWGTRTDKSGFFRIEFLPSGRQEVVASIIGYKTESVTVSLKERMVTKVKFSLKEISYELKQVVITGMSPEKWKKDLEEFKKYFFGDTPFASECKIINPEVINLSSTKSGVLEANSSEPVIIINSALGYKIQCSLANFSWDDKKQTLKYLDNLFFTELKDTTGNQKNSWAKNREEAYYGSFNHFIKSLIRGTFTEEGFRVYRDKYHSLIYKSWREIREPVITHIDSTSSQLNFNGYLRIEYELGSRRGTEISWIKLNYPDVVLDKYGFPVAPYAFEIYGDWAYGGISDMLPKYYNPESK